jgi:hypothetical protein
MAPFALGCGYLMRNTQPTTCLSLVLERLYL